MCDYCRHEVRVAVTPIFWALAGFMYDTPVWFNRMPQGKAEIIRRAN